MNLVKRLGIVLLSTILIGLPVIPASAQSATTAQDSQFALQRGYRTGYSDGYMSGYRDTIDGLARSYTRHEDYMKANRAYSKDYGSLDDFRDGYQQGFESGYDTGFERRSFESNLPTELKRRGIVNGSTTNLATDTTTPDGTMTNGTSNGAVTVGAPPVATAATTTETQAQTYPTFSSATYLIPRDTELILELQEDLSTERSRTGDKFTAKIVSPSEIAGATIEGRVAKITAPGRIKRRSELALSFDRIVLNDARWSNFSGQLIEVMPVKGDNVKRVDNEGAAIGKSSIKGDVIKVGAATGTGAVIGGVVGGPVGVAVGAGMGAAFGVGAVVIERGKHVRLGRNQQVRIKTAYETQIR